MQSKKILVVEDDEAIREVIKQVLEIEGYDVFTASNGREGVEILKRGKDLPGVILLDLMMPIMNGWEFIEAKREEKDLADIPVVVLSASGRTQIPEGANAYFQKPIEVDALLKVAHDYCAAYA